MKYRIAEVGPDSGPLVLELVNALLTELGEEADESGVLMVAEMMAVWVADPGCHTAFLARTEDGTTVGVATLSTAFALYAAGRYGILNEMYVVPEWRSRGVGAQLIEAVAAHGRKLGWRRIDVTAPESERWDRTREFYERQGFEFTGPKLKLLLD